MMAPRQDPLKTLSGIEKPDSDPGIQGGKGPGSQQAMPGVPALGGISQQCCKHHPAPMMATWEVLTKNTSDMEDEQISCACKRVSVKKWIQNVTNTISNVLY